jgi:hypothetical protein
MTGAALEQEGGDGAASDFAAADLALLRHLAEAPTVRPSVRIAARRELAALRPAEGARDAGR